MSRKKKHKGTFGKGLHAVSSFFDGEDRNLEEIDWDAEIWGDNPGSFDPAAHDLEPVNSVPVKAPKAYGKSHGSSWTGGLHGWGFTPDPTDAEWDIRRAERHRKEAEREARDRMNKAGTAFKEEFEAACDVLTDAELEVVVALLGKHTDMVIAKVQEDIVKREEERMVRGGSIPPAETMTEFLDLGARLYEALELDPFISKANLDLVAASLDALSYIHPARNWDEVTRERERAADKALSDLGIK